MNRNVLRGYPVGLKGTGNRADTKVSKPIKLNLFFPSVKHQKEGNVMQPAVHFPVIVNRICNQILCLWQKSAFSLSKGIYILLF